MAEVYMPDMKSEDSQHKFDPKYAVPKEAPQGFLTKGCFDFSSSSEDAGGSTGRQARSDKTGN